MLPVESTVHSKPVDTDSPPDSRQVPTHFLLRRLHAITGIIPLSAYLIIHFFVSATAMSGRDAYDSLQTGITHIPLIVPFEILVIVLPLTFHAVYGITIAVRSRNSPFTMPYLDNFRYALQRYTGYFLAIFIIFHLHFLWMNVRFTADGKVAFAASPYGFVHGLLADHTFMVLYTLGVAAAAFHCANGIWAAGITWGMASSSRMRRTLGYASAALFVILAFLGFGAVQAFYAGGK